jgi:hypothetical protein
MNAFFIRWLSCLFFVLFAITGCNAQEAAGSEKDKQDVVALIKNLYKIKPEIYYFAEFPKIGHSREKQAELLKKFFENDLMVRRNSDTGKIDPQGNLNLPNLYPYETEPNDLMAENRSEPLPTVRVGTPEFDGQRAKLVAKIAGGSLVHFFLNKRSEGWRIYKARTFSREPANLYFLESNKLADGYFGYMVEYPRGQSFSEDNVAMKLSPW